MPNKTFFAFILPSLIAMVLFIALPIVSVVVQSLYVSHEQIMVEVENCQPFGGCSTELRVDTAATAALREEQPLGRFNGLGTYVNRAHLATTELGVILSSERSIGEKWAQILNLPFYKALIFTLVYCFVVTPLAMALGFTIALAVNALPKVTKGPIIFFSLLPMIITPLIGSLILYWMLSPNGILGATIQHIFNDPTLSLRASPALTWGALLTYGVWTNAPFSFVVFYAGLQTVPGDTLESAMIDGASR